MVKANNISSLSPHLLIINEMQNALIDPPLNDRLICDIFVCLPELLSKVSLLKKKNEKSRSSCLILLSGLTRNELELEMKQFLVPHFPIAQLLMHERSSIQNYIVNGC